MTLRAALAVALLAGAPPAAAGVAEDLGLSEAEAVYCESELAVVENRLRVFRAQHLPAAEQHRRNAEPQTRLDECRARFRDLRRRDAEDEQVRAEVARRLPPSGGEVQRERLEREVRLERARARPSAALRPDERQLLSEERAQAVRERAAAEQRNDPRARRPALSAQLCLAERDLAQRRAERETEARLSGLGDDGTRRYFLRGEIHRLEAVASESRAALADLGGPLPCTRHQVAEVARCLDLGLDRSRSDERCQAPEVEAPLQSLR